MIGFFKDEYEGFSNFTPCVIYYNHYNLATVEHAFQAAKTLDSSFIYVVSQLPAEDAGKVKRMGKKVKLRKDWEKIKMKVMERFVRQKFSQEKFRNLLISTGDEHLEEGNWWHDNFWGNCHCKKCKDKKGENHLGKILMKLREEFNTNRERINNRGHPRRICKTE